MYSRMLRNGRGRLGHESAREHLVVRFGMRLILQPSTVFQLHTSCISPQLIETSVEARVEVSPNSASRQRSGYELDVVTRTR
jgi:hypothetical protein